jgi:hypothetical protein
MEAGQMSKAWTAESAEQSREREDFFKISACPGDLGQGVLRENSASSAV